MPRVEKEFLDFLRFKHIMELEGQLTTIKKLQVLLMLGRLTLLQTDNKTEDETHLLVIKENRFEFMLEVLKSVTIWDSEVNIYLS